MIKQITLLLLGFLMIVSCTNDSKNNKNSLNNKKENGEIVLYTHRHYDVDKEIFKAFEEKTGIKVKVTKASADQLIKKMEIEGDQSPADILITADAGRLVRAKQKGLLQPINSEKINATVPAHLRDAENEWFGITKRARIIAYDKNKVKESDLSTYEDLAEGKWKNRILIRTSSNIYNQSLLASIIANDGKEKAKEWAAAITNNMARVPKGNDRDQVKAITAGEGDIAVVNTYYIGKLLNSKDAKEKEAGEAVNIFFPNQNGRGAHINISGLGVAKHAKNKANAVQFIEYLISKDVQEKFAAVNYEYPVNPNAEMSELLKSWGTFKEDNLPLSKLGELNKEAVQLLDEVAWDKGSNAK